jgi:rare lipoprotein A
MRGAAPGRGWARGSAWLGLVLITLASPDAGQAAKRLDTQVGKASIYSKSLDGKKMADGKHLDTDANVAASKTLPLGTVAKVTNLDNGKSTTVTVEDRGPFVRGRVVDLSPAAAKQVGLTKRQGVAPVAVKPISVP